MSGLIPCVTVFDNSFELATTILAVIHATGNLKILTEINSQKPFNLSLYLFHFVSTSRYLI